MGTNFPLFLAKSSILLYLASSSFLTVKPIMLAPTGSDGIMNFLARSSVYQAPLVPISYLPDSSPIKRSSSLVPVYSNL